MRPLPLLLYLASSVVLPSLGQQYQIPFGTGSKPSAALDWRSTEGFPLDLQNAQGTFNVTELHLSQLTTGQPFTTLRHPKFPHHQVRVKKTQFCDPTVNVYTGFLDIDQGAKHLFFYFFESRRDPDKDDVMMWINGGPGGSSTVGLLMELGPCNIDTKNVSSNGTLWNPYSWNNEANIFFLDQPVGVGFSYADYGETIETTEDAAKNVHAFITIFFETFSQFKGRPFHMAGESYGGRYLPVFAGEIVDRNAIAKAEGRQTINLQSVMIGNGITDFMTEFPGKYAVECSTASLDTPGTSISSCVRMKQVLPRCQALLKRHCFDENDLINCSGAMDFCRIEFWLPYEQSGRNVYDLTKKCVGNNLCYEEVSYIEALLNNKTTRELIGIEHDRPFSSVNYTITFAFWNRGDWTAAPTQYYVAGLLERGVRVLIYAGSYDWICNWVSEVLWLEILEWSGKIAYNREKFRIWGIDEVDSSVHDWLSEDGTISEKKRAESGGAGITKSAGPLTFASIWGGGHMMSIRFHEWVQYVWFTYLCQSQHAPFDKPAEALAMVHKWLKGEL